MKKYLLIAAFFINTSLFADTNISPKEALQRLTQGNKRFTEGKLEHPDRTLERRLSLVNTQTPFAAILGCSDSRVSPEIVFDQGIGDLFIVRVAGNVAGPVETDSVEYSALILGSSIVVVLGHENCGAVKAVLAHNTKDIEAVANLIKEGLQSNIENLTAEDAIKENVRNVVKTLQASPPLRQRINQGTLLIVGAYYHLADGHVEFLDLRELR